MGRSRPGENITWNDVVPLHPEGNENFFLFRLKKEDRGKINELGYKFIYDVVERNLVKSILIKLGEESFCVLCSLQEKADNNLEENPSVHKFLSGSQLSDRRL